MNGKIIKSVPYVERHMLDWIMAPDLKKECEIQFKKYSDGSFGFGEHINNELEGRGFYLRDDFFAFIGNFFFFK